MIEERKKRALICCGLCSSVFEEEEGYDVDKN